ncbi:cytochrome P450 2D20-like [Mercenaria mercenaria]|uniref:cytochrome P450 2D20-like n=1 Tax=Mercenaria mercenaria TaxID=6596 RepID=UPI00234F9789|nr:cytochrome P450 2D20-like [Mercenaria mercenaria]XP_045207379.2 cytochrome P450 2D20-like [Mercenaria mercenaria]XP_045207380.2 cytochrome P450 2D20-like [Mercenaria mercenaria]XP_045207382.2 cytochrome P450 2D20-like [Mercenaria mercenaria]XP_045207383.2 cytochrome P450 2D20-like [Mercenaria mercenaria]
MIVTVILVCFVLVAVVLWTLVGRSKEKERRPPPGPRGLPFVGQGFHLSINSAHLQFSKWSKEYGDVFMFSVFGKNVCVLNSPDTIWSAFYEKQLSDYTSDRPGSFIGQYIADSYKDILFRRYDDLCKKLKGATIKAMYSSGSGNDIYITQQQTEINEFIRKITRDKGNDVNIIEPLETTLCKLIGIMFTGEIMEDSDPAFKALLDFDHDGNEMITPSVHFVLKILPVLRYFPGYYGDLYRRTVRSRNNLRAALLNKLKDEFKTKRRECLLHSMFSFQEEEHWLTDDLILGVVMDLINTSTLTSRGVLSGIYFLLVHFQNVQEKICQEIDAVIGQDRQPVPSDLQNMPYTHACILETLRYQSHLGLSATHTNTSSDITIDDYVIPKGTSLYGNQFHVHHDDMLWVDPWVFKPERFLQENGNVIPREHELRNRYLMPFGVGNRSCMGVTKTFHRMFLFVTILLQKHKLLAPSAGKLPSNDPRELKPGTVLQAPEFKCRVVDRFSL